MDAPRHLLSAEPARTLWIALPEDSPDQDTEQACIAWIERFFSYHGKRQQLPALIARLSGLHKLMAELMHCTGLGAGELLQLRVRDVDLDRSTLVLCTGGTGPERRISLPEALRARLRMQLLLVRAQHRRDLDHGFGEVPLPVTVATLDPAAAWDIEWQFLFPATTLSRANDRGTLQRLPVRAAELRRSLLRVPRALQPIERPSSSAHRRQPGK
jgi:integrase